MGPFSSLVTIVVHAAVHIDHQPANERKPQPLPALFGGHEWLKDVIAHGRIDTRTIIRNAQFDRQANRLALRRGVELQSAGKASADNHLRLRAIAASLVGIGKQVDQNLHQRVDIAQHRRERRIELLDHCRYLSLGLQSSGIKHRSGAADCFMEIAGRQNLWRATTERLHLVDQLGDPVYFTRNQAGKRQLRTLQFAPKKLGRTANSGERVLDLMRQDFRRAQQYFAVTAKALVHRADAADVMNGEHLPTKRVDHRCDRHVDLPGPLTDEKNACCTGRNLRLAIGQAFGQAGLIKAEQLGKLPSDKPAIALAKKLFSSRIGIGDSLVRPQKQHRQRQAGKLALGVGCKHQAASR